MTSKPMRSRYLSDAVATASPERLVVLLYDRLALDLTQAGAAMRDGRHPDADGRLRNAQAIVLELRASLDVAAWDAGQALADIYGFLVAELVSANVYKDVGRVDACLRLVEPLRDAWHQVADGIAAKAS